MTDFINPVLGIWLAIVLGAILFFFLIRHLLCWYWKINDIIKLSEKQLLMQNETVRLLKKLTGEDVVESEEDNQVPDVVELNKKTEESSNLNQ